MRTLRLAIRRLEARLYDIRRMTDEELGRFVTGGEFDFGKVSEAQLERIARGQHPERVLSAKQLAECRARARARAAGCA
jgi:hypothetical protein